MAMQDVTYDVFIADYPEFAGLPQRPVERKLELANMTLNKGVWGPWFEQAVELWTAHYLAVRYNIEDGAAEEGIKPPTGVAIVATNYSANTGGLSEGGTPSALLTSDDPLTVDMARTEYGLEYLALLKLIIPPGGIVYSPSVAATAGRRIG